MYLYNPAIYLSLPYIWLLIDFVTVQPPQGLLGNQLEYAGSTEVSQPVAEAEPMKLKVYGSIKQPDIVILAEPTNPTTSAIVLKVLFTVITEEFPPLAFAHPDD